MPMCCAAFAAPLYLFKEGIEIIGGLWTSIEEDLKGDSIVGLGGDSVGGLWIGDVDVTIWRGVDGVGTSVPPRGARGPAGSLPR